MLQAHHDHYTSVMGNMGKKRPDGVTDEKIIETYLRLRAGRKTGDELGIGEATVYRCLAKHGIKTDGLARYRKSITRFQGQEAEIRAWYEAGDTHDQIRDRLGGASDYAIKHAIKRAGGELRPNPVPTIKPGEVEQIREMYESGMTQAEICRETGRSQSSIWRVMSEHGIQPRRYAAEAHGNWAGGRTLTGHGYWNVRVESDDPLASMRNNRGYVLEHRLVMARSLGRPLLTTETVHHINGDRTDNRIENLQLRQGKHGKGSVMVCLDCGSHNLGHAPIAED